MSVAVRSSFRFLAAMAALGGRSFGDVARTIDWLTTPGKAMVRKPTMVKPPLRERPYLCSMEMPTENPKLTRTQRYRNHLKSSSRKCLRCGVGL